MYISNFVIFSLKIICENDHPSIISKEELNNAMKRKHKTSCQSYKPKFESDYLLSGMNIENNYLFICSECGGHIIGLSTGKKHNKKYGCGNNRHKGICSCTNNWKIDKDWLEEKIVKLIEDNYICDNSIEKNIEDVYNQISNIHTIYDKEIKKINNKISIIDKQIQNLLNSIKYGINPTLVVDEINNLKIDKDNLTIELSDLKNNLNHIFIESPLYSL